MNQKRFNSYSSFVSASFLSIAVGLLGTACAPSQTALQAADVQAESAANSIAETESTHQDTYNQDAQTISEISPSEIDYSDAYTGSEYDTSEIDYSDACIRDTCETPPPRPLSIDELNTIASELGPEEILIAEQSFALTLPIIGRADLIATENMTGHLTLRLRGDANQYEEIYTQGEWKLWKLKAMAFEDIHQDGDGPDIIVIAEYVTGMGTTGALPFTAPVILFNRGDDTFQNDIAVNSVLSEYSAQTVEDVITAAKADGLVRGLQYYEGP